MTFQSPSLFMDYLRAIVSSHNPSSKFTVETHLGRRCFLLGCCIKIQYANLALQSLPCPMASRVKMFKKLCVKQFKLNQNTSRILYHYLLGWPTKHERIQHPNENLNILKVL